MMRWLFLFMLVVGAVPLMAGEPQAPVLMVDVKRVLDESRAAVGAQKKIEIQRRAFQEEISIQEKRIREAEQELVQARGKLDAKQYAEKENQLRQGFRDVEKYVQERRQMLEKATTSSMGRVRDALLDIVKDMALKRGAQAVLVKQQVLWAKDGLDVTDEVLITLNQKLPEVAVEMATSAMPPAPIEKPVPALKDKGKKAP